MPADKDLEQRAFFYNRLVKRDRHLRKWARRADCDSYRVYDRDIPEVPLALDRYGERAVLYLYERPYEKPEAEERGWLALMAEAAAEALEIAPEAVVVKSRKRLGVDEQYERIDRARELVRIREQGLHFLVNLRDYLDTGLFMDHRPARAFVRRVAAGKRVLNLFCYTGSFSVYALAGGAASVTGVDLSNTYLDWARRNIEANGLPLAAYRGARADAAAFAGEEAARGARYDLIILDPPTFSNSKKMEGFLDLPRHWAGLVRSCAGALAPGGLILFSTNARELVMDPSLIAPLAVKDVSAASIPEDFKPKQHRAWLIAHDLAALEGIRFP